MGKKKMGKNYRVLIVNIFDIEKNSLYLTDVTIVVQARKISMAQNYLFTTFKQKCWFSARQTIFIHFSINSPENIKYETFSMSFLLQITRNVYVSTSSWAGSWVKVFVLFYKRTAVASNALKLEGGECYVFVEWLSSFMDD
jgi:hypothetical protein